jgi:hypothetical protein
MYYVLCDKINEFHRMPLFKIAINAINGEKNVVCPCITVSTMIIIFICKYLPVQICPPKSGA